MNRVFRFLFVMGLSIMTILAIYCAVLLVQSAEPLAALMVFVTDAFIIVLLVAVVSLAWRGE